jgi:3-oxoacyl-[acyl-carrier protein] reductase
VADSDVLGLRGKPTLVVGGASGIGRATALLLGRSGADVVVADLDGDRAKAVSDEVAALGVRSSAIAADVTDPAGAQSAVDGAYDALGGLFAVANIVGVAAWASLIDIDLDTWHAQISANLTHHLLVGRAAARRWIDEGVEGRLAYVTSVSGIYGAPDHSAYGAAKAGAIALARTMANEWSGYGIRINTVAPDTIATPRVQAGFAERGISDINEIARGDGVPLGRFGRPEEIAGPLVFLLSDLSGFMTGQTLVVDGGTQARFPHGGPKPFTPKRASD